MKKMKYEFVEFKIYRFFFTNSSLELFHIEKKSVHPLKNLHFNCKNNILLKK